MAARADAIDDIDRLTQAAPPHRGVALVILGEATCARATLEVDADGHAVLRPLGLTVTANQLPAVEAAEVAALLREAADTGPQSEPSREREPRVASNRIIAVRIPARRRCGL